MYLIDTVALSELRKRSPDRNVAGWFERVDAADLFLSVVTIGEVVRGIEGVRRRDPGFAERLDTWIDTVVDQFSDRILPATLPILRRWGRLSAALGRSDADLLIAATAIEHDLKVVTRNVAHFTSTGAAAINPFEASR